MLEDDLQRGRETSILKQWVLEEISKENLSDNSHN